MGVITPNGDMYLIYVDIDITQANQLWFTSAIDQEIFFQGKSVAGLAPADYSFIQKDSLVMVNRNADQLYNCNYLMYRNSAHANRWFFAFIKEIKWMSDYSSAIIFETDVYQTWRFDVAFRTSLVERETPPTDKLGEHLIDEGLELGEYVTSGEVKAGLGPMVICVATTVLDASLDQALIQTPWAYTPVRGMGQRINNIYTGSSIIWWPNTYDGMIDLNAWLNRITDAGAKDAITAIYMCPQIAVMAGDNFITGGTWSKYALSSSTGAIKTVELGQRPIALEGYVPNNKKLLSYPYCLAYAHNGNGSSASFDLDEFSSGGFNTDPIFQLYGNINPLPAFKLVPMVYKKLPLNVDEAINLQSFPMCSYPIDAYKAWMAQNGMSTKLGVAGGTAAAIASVAMIAKGAGAGGAVGGPVGAGVGAGVGTVMAISQATNAVSSFAKLKEAELHPAHSEGSANTGSVNATFNGNDFYLCYKTIRVEWAEMLDQYFTMFGYKVNQLKVPDFGCRSRFYYCKLINPNITGPIPAVDMAKLKQMFTNGVTLWNNHDDIGNYGPPNTFGLG